VGTPIEVEGLTKHYGPIAAVRGLDFQVHAGEVFGLLGPNGAGKTTTVEILEGLRPRGGGRVSVLGFDPAVQARELKNRIGVCLQSTNFPDKMRVREAVELFSSFYTRTLDGAGLLRRLELWDRREAFYSQLSGGQKQRLALTLALLNDPQVLFLDEPSAGLDPQARLEIHGLIQDLRRERRTIVLTTHYIEEAEKLCDRVAIVDEGRCAIMGTPREIRERAAGQSVVEIRCDRPLGPDEAAGLRQQPCCSVDAAGGVVTLVSRHPARALAEILKWLDARGIAPDDIHIQRPSLEDVFIELTGKSLRE
jgi:ABC-2 type transport system ATP-binding protein